MSEEQQKQDKERLQRLAVLVADGALYDEITSKFQEPIGKVRTIEVVVSATIGFLIGQGLVTVVPGAELPKWIPLEVPEHLRQVELD